ncbi:MAG: hypothetical protein KIS79_06305 [Burkholderiales bacterium]|nr:hypothetical protein [Burkholderiales bacterium]
MEDAVDFRDLARVPQIVAESNGTLTEPQVRWWIFNASSNGLMECGAIVKVGRSVLLSRAGLNRWLSVQCRQAEAR